MLAAFSRSPGAGMSCFVRIATRLTDEATLRLAAVELGYKVAEKAGVVKGWGDDEAHADVVIHTGTPYDVGAVRNKSETYDFVGDFSMAHLAEADFVDRMSQAYSKIRVLEAARKSGFVVANQTVDLQGTVQLVLRRFS